MKLNDIRDNEGARKSRVRVGRGIGSGLGKTAGRGQKGQTSRSGVSIKGFEGGQMPLHMRLPKRGFNNIFAKDHAEVNLGAIQKLVDAKKLDGKDTIDHAALKAVGVGRGGKDGVRLLGKGGSLKMKAGGVIAKGARLIWGTGAKVIVQPGTTGTYRTLGRKLTQGNSADNDIIEVLDTIERVTI